ncbi:MAG: hypothetical protein ISS19_03090 [Bacteroidales bacterium]|nr:hypothetical protein [Bacteroidales bacterium]
MKETIRFSKFLLILVLMASVVMNGCKKDEDEGDPPDLPPETALLMDFSAFQDEPGTKKSVETFQNFLQSYLTVFTWDFLAAAAVLVPSIAYAEAFNHDPVYKGENSWEWTYTIPVNQVDFTARLVSKRISNEEFTLKFYVTTSAPVYTMGGLVTLDDFLWFDGTVRYDRTEASWTLYEVGTSVSLLAIDWEKDWEENTWVMTYEIIKPGDIENGSFIEQGHTTDPVYNAYFIVFYSSNTTEIQWETVGFSGHIKAEHSFGDAEWHCWDENKADIDCE